MDVRSYLDLKVWNKALNLVEFCYQVTATFPRSEIFGLIGQLKRAAVSIPSNIAEGSARNHTKELLNFLSISYGSLAELETYFYISRRLLYIDQATLDKFLEQSQEIGRMINGLKNSLQIR